MKLRYCDRCIRNAGLGNGFLRRVSPYRSGGTTMEGRVMRPLSSILVALILAIAPITVANAQTSNPLLNLPSPMPDPNAALQGRIPTPLPTPLQPPAING